MARAQYLSGACAACCAVTFVLQGCGSGSDGPFALVTTTPSSSPVAACMNGWEVDECCCQDCPSLTDGPAFDVRKKDACVQGGGQCKLHMEIFTGSLYLRPPPAKLAEGPHRLRSTAGGTEQHHIIGGEPDEVTISFIQPGEKVAMSVEVYVHGTEVTTTWPTATSSYSFFQNPQGWNGFSGSQRGSEYFPCEHGDGKPFYQNATCMYTSDIIHMVQITELTPSTAYDYRVVGEHDTWRTFRTPPAVGSPINIGFTADLGQTTDSNITMTHMKESFDDGDIDIIVYPGDLSYADGYANAWDTYGRMSDFLFSSVPTSYGVGNHESTSGLENNVNFIPRYGWQSSKTTSSSALWYSFDAGLAHVIMLCSYCDTVEGSAQYVWLRKDLEAVDRERTPWVIGSWHVPFYTSSRTHPMEDQPPMSDGYQPPPDGAQQREAMEGLIIEAKVDIVVQGHVHSYERTHPVAFNETKCDGTVYITIGDGGNHEGPACGWVNDLPWSAKKETSFGFGILTIFNETDAEWIWHRNQDGMKTPADNVFLKTSSTRCDSDPPAAVTV